MKSVLISIKPKWCNLIVNGEKTAEIRKSRPAITTPFKCYIYESMGRDFKGSGKVIGEFVCDRVYQYSTGNVKGIDISDEEITKFSCLTKEELESYEFSTEPKENHIYKVGLYGWKISSLVIYDEPKSLANLGINRPPQSWCYVKESENNA